MTKDQLAKMTYEEKRARIAEICGWMLTREQAPGCPASVPFWHSEGKYCQVEHLPNYLESLDAMHEAEKSREGGMFFQQYLGKLWRVVNPLPEYEQTSTCHIQNYLMRNFVQATARQRADAFLLCAG